MSLLIPMEVYYLGRWMSSVSLRARPIVGDYFTFQDRTDLHPDSPAIIRKGVVKEMRLSFNGTIQIHVGERCETCGRN